MKRTKTARFRSPHRSFSVLEVMVVAGIIGLLALIGARSMIVYQAKARDAQRISALHAVRNALEVYHNDNNAYPPNPLGSACSPIPGTWSYNANCLIELRPYLDDDLFNTPWGGNSVEGTLLYFDYGSTSSVGAVISVRFETTDRPNPCNFPTGAWCNKTPTVRAFCLCSGREQ